ncbi:MAG: class I SAM-dependent methyltransferase [Burkholderiales bacterium]|nr:class I SAM-dependent methyltransferase [Burkholderiales bacterium]
MSESVRAFYDGLAGEYHLMFADWRREIARQGEALDALIHRQSDGAVASLLDCACGIGTQAIALALQGYRVHATDFSAPAAERARREAQSFGAVMTVEVADFRHLGEVLTQRFDVVICCDNALSHCLADDDLPRALGQMQGRLRSGGLFLASIRDYDRLLARDGSAGALDPGLPGLHGKSQDHGPRGTMPQVFDDATGRRIAFQVWDWAPDGRSYAVHQYFVQEFEGEHRTSHHVSRFRALRRAEVDEALKAAGFRDIHWHFPADSGFYQPVVTARA